MLVEWLKDADNKGRAEKEIKNSPALDHLLRILNVRLSETLAVSQRDYSDASWAYLQAHNNGRAEVLRELIKLVASAREADPK